ncbi:DUF2000 domain-containing protein [Desulfosporosinus nitroreducens]|uniref:DUF2000 domain-containing protein n=1 Tax=Desulfosporosinus nitroreducens TaxID=2018668 RepID=A0ABT8QJ27_9FIRM|nr:DUF2000 domain-containing protein [Desulfosporosinus nitroreducens]MCO1600218.1 DUF2000 domain-containing protein [Desulfosporosinus nitroreducens]MDO0821307.1 DUF2000 domain-containing protein [Desulfosporosinus nitroreducens]
MKTVIIVDNELPLGLIANTSAALGLSLGSNIAGLIGPPVKDNNENIHLGITNINMPILSATREQIKKIYNNLKAESNSELIVIDFSTLAQQSKSYDDYVNKMENEDADGLSYLGICIYGAKGAVNKVTGNISTLK